MEKVISKLRVLDLRLTGKKDGFTYILDALICFGGGFGVGMLYLIIKTHLDNRKYNALLSSYKDQHGGEDFDE